MKKEIISKTIDDLPLSSELSELSFDEWYGSFKEVFNKAKRQQAIKLFKEWKECETIEDKRAIETIVQMDFTNFDEDKYIKNHKLLSFIKKAKY